MRRAPAARHARRSRSAASRPAAPARTSRPPPAWPTRAPSRGPPRTAEWTPGPAENRSTPSSLTRYTWISPVSAAAASSPADADTRTSSGPMSSTARSCSCGPVSGRSPTTSTRAPPSSAIRTSRPSGAQAGTPENSSSHTGSSSSCTVRVAPLAVSTARYSWPRLVAGLDEQQRGALGRPVDPRQIRVAGPVPDDLRARAVETGQEEPHLRVGGARGGIGDPGGLPVRVRGVGDPPPPHRRRRRPARPAAGRSPGTTRSRVSGSSPRPR